MKNVILQSQMIKIETLRYTRYTYLYHRLISIQKIVPYLQKYRFTFAKIKIIAKYYISEESIKFAKKVLYFQS